MHLRESENIVRTIRRHLLPFFIDVFKILLAGTFFIVLIVWFGRSVSADFVIIALIVVAGICGFAFTHLFITYRLDRLVITNQRMVWVNWSSFFRKEEHELEFRDIQDIHTREKGILSYFRIFDYGLFQVETAASSVTINFEDAPDPEGIKQFIFDYCLKKK
ncbi:MAG: PH domain-containing protein [Patescibacteria group bacterium]